MSSDATERTIAGKKVYEVKPSNKRKTSTSDTSDRFNQDKKEWAAELDDEATAYLCEHYGVTEDDIGDFEGLTSGEYSHEDVERPIQWIDYAGIDKIVNCGDRFVGVGFRFRPQSETYDVDFSYCVDNGTANQTAEYTKHTTAREKGGLYPTTYAFGITDAAGEHLEEFYLIKMDTFLDCIKTGILNPAGPYTREGGVDALYYSIEELRETGCIEASWGDEK